MAVKEVEAKEVRQMKVEMETLLGKDALCVERTEGLESPEDDLINYELTFVLGRNEPHPITVHMHTDDRSVYEKFKVGKEYRIDFLEQLKVGKQIMN